MKFFVETTTEMTYRRKWLVGPLIGTRTVLSISVLSEHGELFTATRTFWNTPGVIARRLHSYLKSAAEACHVEFYGYNSEHTKNVLRSLLEQKMFIVYNDLKDWLVTLARYMPDGEFVEGSDFELIKPPRLDGYTTQDKFDMLMHHFECPAQYTGIIAVGRLEWIKALHSFYIKMRDNKKDDVNESDSSKK